MRYIIRCIENILMCFGVSVLGFIVVVFVFFAGSVSDVSGWWIVGPTLVLSFIKQELEGYDE